MPVFTPHGGVDLDSSVYKAVLSACDDAKESTVFSGEALECLPGSFESTRAGNEA